MKTINEQLERLRELVRKCYGVIASKNGEVPSEKTMENLPNAIASTHDTLEELTITLNGEYTPQQGVDGFSKVVAEFDTSSLPKIKVSTFKVTDMCINDDGIWEGERLIDTSECTDFYETFKNNTAIKSLDASGWDTSKVYRFYNTFVGCENLRNLNVTGWDVSNVTNITSFLQTGLGKSVKIIGYEDWDVRNVVTIDALFAYKSDSIEDTFDFRKWEIPKAKTVRFVFPTYFLIKSLVGGESLESVINNNTTIIKGLKVSYNTGDRFYINDRASLRALINGLADLTGQTPQTLTLNKGIVQGQTTSAFDTLTEEDIAIATNKNWTITSV